MFTGTYSSLRHSVMIHPLTDKKRHYLWVESKTVGCKCDLSEMCSQTLKKAEVTNGFQLVRMSEENVSGDTDLQYKNSLRKEYYTNQEQVRAVEYQDKQDKNTYQLIFRWKTRKKWLSMKMVLLNIHCTMLPLRTLARFVKFRWGCTPLSPR